MAQPLAHGEALRSRELRQLVAWSALGHLLVLGLLLAVPTPRPRGAALPGVVTVELVAPPAGAPRAAPPAPPRRRAPVERKVVLPAQPADPAPAARPQPVPRPTPTPAQQRDYEDVLRELRSQQGETRPEPQQVARAEAPAAAAAGATAGAGAGVPVSPEVAAWMRDARLHVRRSWVLAPGFRTEPLETHVVVRLDSSGAILGEPEVTRRSGNPWYDESVLRALGKASPLPPPPEAGEWPFVFRPEDSL